MSLKHGLLGFLSYGDMTGYDLAKVFKQSMSMIWKAQTSQIYRELAEMEKTGWLTSKEKIQLDKPNKRIYSITQSGKDELLAWLSDNDCSDMLFIRNEFLMKIFFSQKNSVGKNIEILENFKSIIAAALRHMEQTDKVIDKYKDVVKEKDNALYWSMCAQFGKEYFSMCSSWAEKCILKLKEEENEGFGSQWQS